MKNVDLFIRDVGDYVYANVPIGSLPKVGVPMKDKNGADVYDIPDGVEIQTLDSTTSSPEYRSISKFTVEKDVEVAEVKTKSHSVIVSTNESVAVVQGCSSDLKKVSPADSVGEWVPVLKRSIDSFGVEYDFDLGWWVGSFVSDGWMAGTDTIGYAKKEEAKVRMFERITRNINQGFSSHSYSSSSRKIHLKGKDLFNEVLKMKMDTMDDNGERRPMLKRLPIQMIMDGNYYFAIGIFCGLIDGSGSITINRDKNRNSALFSFKYSTSSPALRDSIKYLCYRLGILVSTTVSTSRGGQLETYSMIFDTRDVLSHECLSFVGEQESEMLNVFKNEYTPSLKRIKDFVVILEDEAALLKRIKYSKSRGGLYSVLTNSKRKTKLGVLATEREVLVELFGDFGEHDDMSEEPMLRLKERVYNSDLVWQRVESCNVIDTRDVFDVAVEGTKVFEVDSGLIIYDTMSTSIPISEKAVKEAWGLLPSKRGLDVLRRNSVAYTPSQEYLHGSIIASRQPKGVARYKFDTKNDAIVALKEGKIKADTPIYIGK